MRGPRAITGLLALLSVLVALMAGPVQAAGHEHGGAARALAAEERADDRILVAATASGVVAGCRVAGSPSPRCCPDAAGRCPVGCTSMHGATGLPAEAPELAPVAAIRAPGPGAPSSSMPEVPHAPWRPPPGRDRG